MSTPPFLEPPPGVERARVPAARGELAALVGRPDVSADRLAPVLFVPGFTGSKEDFIAVLAPVMAAGHPVVAIDQRGQYESPGDGNPSSYDVKALAEDVLAVARHLGEPVHLVGHSFGGLVVRAAALAEPAALRSLTLMCSGPAAIPEPSASNLGLVVAALPGMSLTDVWEAKTRLEAEAGMPPLPPYVHAWMRTRYVANDPVCVRRMAEQLLGEEDSVAELATLDLPVHVLYGEADDAWPPAEQAEMAARLGARHTVLLGAAHSPAAERPEDTARAMLDFFATV